MHIAQSMMQHVPTVLQYQYMWDAAGNCYLVPNVVPLNVYPPMPVAHPVTALQSTVSINLKDTSDSDSLGTDGTIVNFDENAEEGSASSSVYASVHIESSTATQSSSAADTNSAYEKGHAHEAEDRDTQVAREEQKVSEEATIIYNQAQVQDQAATGSNKNKQIQKTVSFARKKDSALEVELRANILNLTDRAHCIIQENPNLIEKAKEYLLQMPRVNKKNREKFRQFIRDFNFDDDTLQYLSKHPSACKELKSIAQSILDQARNSRVKSIVEKNDVEESTSAEKSASKKEGEASNAPSKEPIAHNMSYKLIIYSQDHVAFNDLIKAKKSDRQAKAWQLLYDRLALGNDSAVSDTFLQNIVIPTKKLLTMLDIAGVTHNQRYNIFKKLLEQLLVLKAWKEAFAERELLFTNLKKLKKNISEAQLSELDAIFAQLDESICSEYLPIEKFDLEELLGYLNVTTSRQRAAILSVIISKKLITENKMLQALNLYEGLQAEVQKLENEVDQSIYSNLKDNFEVLKALIQTWIPDKYAQELAELEKMSPNDELDYQKVIFSITSKARNAKGETVLMIAVRKGLSLNSIAEILKLIDKEQFMAEEFEYSQNVLHYWAKYLTPASVGNILPLLACFVKLHHIKSDSSAMHDLQILKAISAYAGRDAIGNTFMHTLIESHNDQALLRTALQVIHKAEKSALFIAAGILVNLEGFTAYSLLEAKDVFLPHFTKELLNHLSKAAVAITSKLNSEMADVFFPAEHNFFNPRSRRPLQNLLESSDISRLILTICARYEIKHEIGRLKFNTIVLKPVENTNRLVLEPSKKYEQIEITPKLVKFFDTNDLLTENNGRLVYSQIIDSVLIWCYPDTFKNNILSYESGTCNLENAQNEKVHAHFKKLEDFCRDLPAFNSVAAQIDITFTIHWRLLLIYKDMKALHEMPAACIEFLRNDCARVVETGEKVRAIDHIAYRNDLEILTFLHKKCNAPIDTHLLAHALAALKTNPKIGNATLNYILNNYGPTDENIFRNIVQDLVVSFVKKYISFDELIWGLQQILSDPEIAVKLLNNTATNQLHLTDLLCVLLTGEQVDVDQCSILMHLFIDKGIKIGSDREPQNNPLFFALLASKADLFQRIASIINHEDLSRYLQTRVDNKLLLEFAYEIKAEETLEPEAKEQIDILCVLIENLYRQHNISLPASQSQLASTGAMFYSI